MMLVLDANNVVRGWYLIILSVIVYWKVLEGDVGIIVDVGIS